MPFGSEKWLCQLGEIGLLKAIGLVVQLGALKLVNISGVFGDSELQVIHFILSFILSCFFRSMIQAS